MDVCWALCGLDLASGSAAVSLVPGVVFGAAGSAL